jgi:NADH:ubiquinone oxidoreductase subunit D
VLRLELQTDGEVQKITCISIPPSLFRKHAENDYLQPVHHRMDYIASMNNSLGYALAVEKLMGIEKN